MAPSFKNCNFLQKRTFTYLILIKMVFCFMKNGWNLWSDCSYYLIFAIKSGILKSYICCHIIIHIYQTINLEIYILITILGRISSRILSTTYMNYGFSFHNCFCNYRPTYTYGPKFECHFQEYFDTIFKICIFNK